MSSTSPSATASPSRAAWATTGASSPTRSPVDRPLVERLRHVDGRAEPEVGGHEGRQARRRPAAVDRPDRRPEPPHPEPRPAAAVAGDLAQAGETRDPPVRRPAHGVDPRAADHGHAPAAGGPGAQGGERVVEQQGLGGEPPRRVRPPEARLVGRQVHAGQAADGELGDGQPRGARADSPASASSRPTRPDSRSRPTCPTAWCDVVGPRTAASSAPAAERSATSVFELPPSTARMRSSHAGEALERVDAHERRPGLPEAVDDRGQRVERPGRPGVEQDDGAVAARRRPGQGVGGHRRAGPPRLPVLEHDVATPTSR